jgi:hypothetical protein
MSFELKCGGIVTGCEIAPNDLDCLEVDIARKLPKEYRACLVKFNGVRFEQRVVCPSQPIPDGERVTPNWDTWTTAARRSVFEGVDELVTFPVREFLIGRTASASLVLSNPATAQPSYRKAWWPAGHTEFTS